MPPRRGPARISLRLPPSLSLAACEPPFTDCLPSFFLPPPPEHQPRSELPPGSLPRRQRSSCRRRRRQQQIGREERTRGGRKGARATNQREPVNGLVVTPAPHPTLPSHPTPNPHPQLEPPPQRPDRRLRRSSRCHLRHGADHHPREDRVSG